jgi:hypothetical protein
MKVEIDSENLLTLQILAAVVQTAALEPGVIEEHDMLWRIKNFFRLDEVSGVNNTVRHTRRRNESESDRK